MNSYIETGISLILVFFIFSVIAYILQEIIAVNLEYRGKVLWKSMAHIFDGLKTKGRSFLTQEVDPKTAPNTAILYAHAQIQSLKKTADRLPSYVPAANFSLALLDLVAQKAPATLANAPLVDKVKAGLTSFASSNGDIYTVLRNLVDTSADVKELQAKIEAWYNEYMDRVTGWYKSHTLLTLRLIALGVTLFFNINVIQLAKDIFTDSEMRGKLVGIAEHVTDHPETVTQYYTDNFSQETAAIDAQYKAALDSATDNPARAAILKEISQKKRDAADTFTKKRLAALDTLTKKLSGTGIPLGWKKTFFQSVDPKRPDVIFWTYAWLVIGWLIAAGCISMGAPFWFDLLVKLVNLRRAGIKPTAEDSKRQ
jgi:hypothetical protein